MSFLGSAQSSDSPVTSRLQCPEFPPAWVLLLSSQAFSRLTLCLSPSSWRCSGGEAVPTAGAASGTGHPFPQADSPFQPQPRAELCQHGQTCDRALPLGPIKGRGDFLMPQASVATRVGFCSTSRVPAGLVRCVRVSAGEHGADTYAQPTI